MHGASYHLVLLLLRLVIAHLVAARRRGAQLVEAVAADPMSTREHADPFPLLVEQTLWCWAEANRACRTHARLCMSDGKGIRNDDSGSHAGARTLRLARWARTLGSHAEARTLRLAR